MNKFSAFILLVFLALSVAGTLAQNNSRRAVTTNVQSDQIFYHTIERGQTVYSIATMYKVSVDDIYRLNPESRAGIKTGSVLKIPQESASSAASGDAESYTFHTIQAKETLYALSVRYKVTPADLMKANPGLSTASFTIGKTIRIPAVQLVTTPATVSQPVTKMTDYTIARQETMYSITRKFNVSSTELLQLNPQLKNGVKSGMTIRVPVRTDVAVAATEPVMQEREVNALLSEPRKSPRVDRIRVALLLPFMADEARMTDASARLVEYYEGMLMAVDSLKRMGCAIELSVYDTGNGPQKLKTILQEEALREAHLIIGAVQNDQIRMIADFAAEHQIKYVIPFTSRNDDVLSNASVFQVNTPHSYLFDIAAQAGSTLFANDNIIIVRTPDNEEKPEFIQAFTNELKGRGIAWKELTYVAETFAVDMEKVLDKGRRNVVLPTSASFTAVSNIKTPLRMLSEPRLEEIYTYQISLFGYPEWQTYTRDCLEDFYALNTYIYSYFFAYNLSPEVQSFYTSYKNWFSKSLINIFPKYGILGFDTGMFFFDAIRRYGTGFENNLDKIHYKSIQTGFHFERVNNWGGFINTNLFIVQYKADNTVTRIALTQ